MSQTRFFRLTKPERYARVIKNSDDTGKVRCCAACRERMAGENPRRDAKRKAPVQLRAGNGPPVSPPLPGESVRLTDANSGGTTDKNLFALSLPKGSGRFIF